MRRCRRRSWRWSPHGDGGLRRRGRNRRRADRRPSLSVRSRSGRARCADGADGADCLTPGRCAKKVTAASSAEASRSSGFCGSEAVSTGPGAMASGWTNLIPRGKRRKAADFARRVDDEYLVFTPRMTTTTTSSTSIAIPGCSTRGEACQRERSGSVAFASAAGSC
jgi:hypothetical protein